MMGSDTSTTMKTRSRSDLVAALAHLRAPRSRQLALWVVIWLAILGAWTALAPVRAMGQDAAQRAAGDAPSVIVLTFDGPVTPVLHQYLEDAIDAAVANGDEAIILRLDTPGGSVEITKSITQLMLGSPVPVVAYVSPSGAHAGSAGTFVTLAAHAAAMAPGSSIGAASPVDMGGGDIDETMRAKIENILSADVENLAGRRGEDAKEWAIAAVRDAQAATAEQALALGVVDFIAVDVDDLLNQLDGFEVTVDGRPETLNTAGAVQEPLELTPLQQVLNFLSNPTVATLLLSLGILGIFVEIRTPGFGFPGITGIIALLLAFFGLGQMDANMVGMVLMGVALILFVAEAFTPTFGVLAVGGVAAFIAGAALLFNTPGIRTPWVTIIAMGVAAGAFVVFIGAKALAAQRKKPITGAEGMIGETARAKTAFAAGEVGSVFVMGEWWNARLTSGSVDAGDIVNVVGRDGYTLLVDPAAKSSKT
jgi:membrane-bound serine protease (ClpP class)